MSPVLFLFYKTLHTTISIVAPMATGYKRLTFWTWLTFFTRRLPVLIFFFHSLEPVIISNILHESIYSAIRSWNTYYSSPTFYIFLSYLIEKVNRL